MKYDFVRQAIGRTISQAAGLLIYSALDDKIRARVARMTARRDVYDKGFADGYDRAAAEGGGGPQRPIAAVPEQS